MKILVDIDGVCADIHSHWLDLYNKDFDDNLSYESITRWGIHEFVKPQCGTKIYDYLRKPDFYNGVKKIEGSYLVEKLEQLGHDIYYVSAGFYPEKVKWLYLQGFPLKFPYHDSRWDTVSNVILAHDKEMIKGDVLIDDRIENVENFLPNKGILFTQSWNKDYQIKDKRIQRADNWIKIVEIISLWDLGY